MNNNNKFTIKDGKPFQSHAGEYHVDPKDRFRENSVQFQGISCVRIQKYRCTYNQIKVAKVIKTTKEITHLCFIVTMPAIKYLITTGCSNFTPSPVMPTSDLHIKNQSKIQGTSHNIKIQKPIQKIKNLPNTTTNIKTNKIFRK